MADTLDDVAAHVGHGSGSGKVVVWEHNSHLGDARATEMGRGGEINVGQLVRERHPGQVVNVGFTTYTGTVTAADDWGGAGHTKPVNVALDGSHEDLLHRVAAASGHDRFLVPLRGSSPAAEALRRPRLERAIGVIYRPRSERISHYFEARLSDQFDAVIHLDETSALQPLA
jgi:erythromycin esterase-like protein